MRNSTKICILIILFFAFFRYSFCQPTWQEINAGGPPISDTKKIAFFDFQTGWQLGGNGVSKTTDSGQSWEIKTPYQSLLYEDLFFLNENTGWISEQFHLMKTTNGGENWVNQAILYPGASNNQIHKEIFFLNELTGYVVTTYYIVSGQALKYYYMISKTTNAGSNWIPIYESPYSTDAAINFNSVKFFDENNGFGIKKVQPLSGSQSIEFLKTSDGGLSWTKINQTVFPQSGRGKAFYLNENTMWILHDNTKSIYKSSDGGINWRSQLTSPEILSDLFFTTNEVGFVLTRSGRMYWTSNGGNDWSIQNIDTNRYFRYLFFLNNDTGWTGSGSYTLRTINASTVNITPISSEIPNSFALKQNYPNPFNPSTKIRFDIPVNSKQVRLSVYNSIGQEVAVMIDEQLQPGVYEYDFNASSYPSGVYFYRLHAGEFSETKRMVLIK